MAYKRIFYKNGKRYEYYYQSYRDETGKIKKIYLGKMDENGEFKKRQDDKINKDKLKSVSTTNNSVSTTNNLTKTEINRNWRKNNSYRINMIKKRYYKNHPDKNFNLLQRKKTRRIFGKLEDGYIYHHYTNPYQFDKFIILEKGLHDYMHRNPKSFKVGGLIR